MTNMTGAHIPNPLVIRFFSVLRERLGQSEILVPLDQPERVAQVLDRLVGRYPELAAYRTSMRAAVNMEYVDESFTVFNGDELAVITPVSGG